MPESFLPSSIMAVDCGSINTHAVMLDVVSGSYRMVARATTPTTAEPPYSDVSEGVRRVIAQIQAVIGRPLLAENGRLIVGSRNPAAGVDVFVATASVAEPLRLILAGLMEEFDLASARRAAAATYTSIEDVISLNDGRGEEDHIALLANRRPDAVVIVGGTDGGAISSVRRLLEEAVLAGSLVSEPDRFNLVYAGNSALRDKLPGIVGGRLPVSAADNVRPRLDAECLEPVQAELEALYESRRLARLPGFDELYPWSESPALPTARAFGRTIQFLSARGSALGVDVGSSATTVAAGRSGRLSLTVRADLGVGHNVARLLEATAPAEVIRWLPFPLDPADVRDFVWNKALHPATIPQEPEEVWLEQALAREALRLTAASSGQWAAGSTLLADVIVASGSTLARAPRPGQTALMLLDALQPVGVSTLLADVNGLVPALGAVAPVQPVAMVQALGNDGLLSLGTVIAPAGTGVPGQSALHLKLTHPAGGDLEVDVAYGSLEVVPLPAGEKVQVSFLDGALSPSLGRRGEGGEGGNGTLTIAGGAVGLIIDARGRPLRLPGDPEARMARLQQWLSAIGG